MKQLLNIILTVLILLTVTNIQAQKWSYQKGENEFDGEYRTAMIEGYSTNTTYNKPIFVINYIKNNINIYISNAGYAGCSNKSVKIKFDNYDKIFTFDVLTNSNKDSWFLPYFNFQNHPTATKELIKMFMRHRKFFVRISSNCGQSDLEFSLNGSANAIKFVLPDNINNL